MVESLLFHLLVGVIMGRGKQKPDQDISRGFADRLRQFVGDGEMASFGKKAGTTGEMISRYLDGTSLPRADTLLNISKSINKSTDWLRTGEIRSSECPVNCDKALQEVCKDAKTLIKSETRWGKVMRDGVSTCRESYYNKRELAKLKEWVNGFII